MNLKLKEKIRESLSAVLPITGIVLMISIFLIPMELGTIVMFLTGAIMLIVGMGFFQLGAEDVHDTDRRRGRCTDFKIEKAHYCFTDRSDYGNHHYDI